MKKAPPSEGASRSRPGGRSAKVVGDIRRATLELLAARGYDGVEIPEIAELAGVNRTTVYRRWPTKAALILDVMLEEMRTQVPTPDTGSFVGDYAQLLQSVANVLAKPQTRSLFRSLLDLEAVEPTYAELRRRFWDERFAASGAIVSRAIRRGELPNGVSPRAILELGSAPLYFRILALGETVKRRDIADIAAWVADMDFSRSPSHQHLQQPGYR